MYYFVGVARNVTDTSIYNIVETCYACKLPYFEEDIQKRFIFFFSEKEPANKSKKRLQKEYKFAQYRSVPNLGHGGLQASQPKKYAEYLKNIIKE